MTDVRVHDLACLSDSQRKDLLRRSEVNLSDYLTKVQGIIDAVRNEGDEALVRFGQSFDGASGLTADRLVVTQAEFDDAFRQVDDHTMEAIRFGLDNIRAHHTEQLPSPLVFKEIRPGAFAGDRFTPIQSVGLYVPRGKGAFPSTTMMLTVPAVLAHVPHIAIFTPPCADGTVDPATLVVAQMTGVRLVYKIGGAQAVAAAAFGSQTVQPVIKIVGPGSPWVVAAKRVLSHVIDGGLPAGPSESLIFADETVHGGLAALDLLIEAEHGPDSSAYLVTHSQRVINEALSALPLHWSGMISQRVEYSRAVLCGDHGGIVRTRNADESLTFINHYAPEHLQILSQDPFAYLGRVSEASEVLLGPHTPGSIANFGLGANAVLPTSAGARMWGPLSVLDFMKRSSVGYVTAGAYQQFADQARTMARYEGFSAHAEAVSDARLPYIKRL